ncbi:MAG: hypothetical protein CMQ38_06885 [Gammaproteobacteria bacterium]|nr:hypothetical protein [Gammaproteobacteria bacterium]
MTTPIVILHGWSDDKESFRNLAHKLQGKLERPITDLWLGDYISLDDDVNVDDIIDAMQRAWLDAKLPTADVIIHSTGGLVIRHWMQKYYVSKNSKPPIRNLVMLAPANFGSPLAHTGRTILGRIFKGDREGGKPFQTGTHVLKSLEMASPYTWQLAEKDRFAPNAFSKFGVRCTVIVGNHGYKGLRSLANKDGSDGTVYVATANLNCARLPLRVKRQDGEFEVGKIEEARGETAFLVLDGFDHGSVTGNKSCPAKLLNPIVEALTVTQKNFPDWKRKCATATARVTNKYSGEADSDRHAFQNLVVHVIDDQGNEVDDYVIEFYGDFLEEEDELADVFNQKVVRGVHAYKDNASYRSFMIDSSVLFRYIDSSRETLSISLSALPDINQERTLAGYRTFEDDDIGALKIPYQELKKYFSPHRTLFVEITLPRYQKPEVFSLENLQN